MVTLDRSVSPAGGALRSSTVAVGGSQIQTARANSLKTRTHKNPGAGAAKVTHASEGIEEDTFVSAVSSLFHIMCRPAAMAGDPGLFLFSRVRAFKGAAGNMQFFLACGASLNCGIAWMLA